MDLTLSGLLKNDRYLNLKMYLLNQKKSEEWFSSHYVTKYDEHKRVEPMSCLQTKS